MGEYTTTEYETVSKQETRVQCDLCGGVSEESDPELWTTLSAAPEVEVKTKEDKFAHYGVTEEDVTRYITMMDSHERSELRRHLVRRDRHAGETVTLSPDGKTGHWAHGSVNVKLKHDGGPQIDLCPGCLESAVGAEDMAATVGREVSDAFAEALYEERGIDLPEPGLTTGQFLWTSAMMLLLGVFICTVVLPTFGLVPALGATTLAFIWTFWIWFPGGDK